MDSVLPGGHLGQAPVRNGGGMRGVPFKGVPRQEVLPLPLALGQCPHSSQSLGPPAKVRFCPQIHMKTMPAAMYRLLTAQEQPVYI